MSHSRNAISFRRGRRSGAVTLETILALPVLAMALLAILAFGMLTSSLQQVAIAAREGARTAAETASLPSTGAVPPAVVDAVERHFEEAGASTPLSDGEYEIRLVHNLNGAPSFLESNAGGLESPSQPALDPAPPTVGTYVRLTVAVRGSRLAPNVLATFGFDLDDYAFEQTVSLPHEP